MRNPLLPNIGDEVVVPARSIQSGLKEDIPVSKVRRSSFGSTHSEDGYDVDRIKVHFQEDGGYSTFEEGAATSDSGLQPRKFRKDKTRGRRNRTRGAARYHSLGRVNMDVAKEGRVYGQCFARELDTLAAGMGLQGGKYSSYSSWRKNIYEGGVVHLSILLTPSESVGANAQAGFSGLAGSEESLSQEKHIFLLPNGCAIFWNMNVNEERFVIERCISSSKEPLPASQRQDDDIVYTYEQKAYSKRNEPENIDTTIEGDIVFLVSMQHHEKLAISLALAHSLKLFYFEERVDSKISSTKEYPQKLATTGKIDLNQTEIAKLIGELFIVRNSVNLYSDILDTPDVFWEEDKYQPTYENARMYFDIDKRIEVMNSRMGIIRELLDLMSAQQEQTHGLRLEWIIIWLILIEVAVEVCWQMLLKDVFGFFPIHPDKCIVVDD